MQGLRQTQQELHKNRKKGNLQGLLGQNFKQKSVPKRLIMQVKIKVHAAAGIVEGVKKLDSGEFKINVAAQPVKGKANEKLIEIIAEYFKKQKSKIRIVKGVKNKNKVIEIAD
jgi:uncharacterized protein YggU (UPF0235/DUF167 family)